MRTEVALFLLLTFSASVLARSFYKNDEQRLYSHLMHKYIKYGRPVYDSHDLLTVNTKAYLQNFASFDTKTREMTLVFLVINDWTDVQLKWEPAEFGGLKYIHIPADKVWNPEIHPFNINKPTLELFHRPVTVSHEGVVASVPYLRQTLLCNAGDDEDHFVCEQRLGSSVYTVDELAIKPTLTGGIAKSFVPHPDWALTMKNVSVETLTMGGAQYPMVRTALNVIRRTHQVEHHEEPVPEHHEEPVAEHHEEPEAEHHEEHHEEAEHHEEKEHHEENEHHEEPEAEHHEEAKEDPKDDHHSKEEQKETEGSGEEASVEDKKSIENEVLSWLF